MAFSGFKLLRSPVAQWITRSPPKRKTVGSIPTRAGCRFFYCLGSKIEPKVFVSVQVDSPVAQWITRLPSKQKIVGSTPTRAISFFMYY